MWHVFSLQTQLAVSNNTVIVQTANNVDEDGAVEIASQKTRMTENTIRNLFVHETYYDLTDVAYTMHTSVERLHEHPYVSMYGMVGKQGHAEGMSCGTCNKFFEYSESNQKDGTLKCWECRNIS